MKKDEGHSYVLMRNDLKSLGAGKRLLSPILGDLPLMSNMCWNKSDEQASS
jgi:hypothetical protein